MNDDNVNALIALYEETGRNFRFFLTWRRLLLAGQFAVTAGVATALKPVRILLPGFLWAVPALGAVVTLFILFLDRRNTQLIKGTADAAKLIERELGHAAIGTYATHKSGGRLGHTYILLIIYLAMFAVLLLWAIGLCIDG